MGQAGYNTQVSIGSTPVRIDDEPMSRVSGQIFQITDGAKRVISRSHQVAIYIGSALIPVANRTFDYAVGKVTFASSVTVNDTVTIDAHFIPILTVATAKSYSITFGTELLESTSFSSAQLNNGYRSREYGLLDASVTISKFLERTDLFLNALQSRTPMLIEIKPNRAEKIIGWFVVEATNRSGGLSDLEMEEVTLQLDSASNGTAGALTWETI